MDLDRAVRSWEEWDRGIRAGDPRAIEALGRLLTGIAGRGDRPRWPDADMSPREIEVLQAAADGARNSEIAAAIGVSEWTVKSHMKRINVKLRAHNRPHAVALAFERGLIR